MAQMRDEIADYVRHAEAMGGLDVCLAQSVGLPEPASPEEIEALGFSPPALDMRAYFDAAAAMAWLGKCMPGPKVEGVQLPSIVVLDPTKAQQYSDVVKNKDFAETKDLLAGRMGVWAGALDAGEDLESIIERAQQRLERLEQLLNKNLKAAYETIRPLETTYRAIDGFFMNAAVEAGDKVKASFINASPDQLLNPNDRTVFEEGLAAAIQTHFRDFTLRETYANLCVPGWVGSVANLDRLGALGSQNKTQVFTDSENYANFQDLQARLDQRPFAGLRGAGLEKQYLTLFGNWLLGRKAHAFEDQDLYLPPSALMSGLIYKTDEVFGIHQAGAGWRKGKLQGVEGLRFRIDRPTAGTMQTQYGVNPIVDFDGYPIAMGDANLCSKAGLDAYPRIRTEDWLVKNVCQYLNKQAYESITDEFRSAVKSDLFEFLSERKGEKNEIKDFKIDVVATPEMEKRHEVDVRLEIAFKHSVRQFNVKVKESKEGPDAQVQQGA